MPRKDKTFKASDVIRFWCENLDEDEQFNVLAFYHILIPDLLEAGAGSTIRKLLIAALRDKLPSALARQLIQRLLNVDLDISRDVVLRLYRDSPEAKQLISVVTGCLTNDRFIFRFIRALNNLQRRF